ncbi:MAG: ISL3 family transposase [Deltaproteobacteria bacterium]|nr:ISL3 family transposase [Deltaproteobacteria bacterium]
MPGNRHSYRDPSGNQGGCRVTGIPTATPLGIKDHRVVSIKLRDNHLNMELDVKKRRRLRCSICGRRCQVKDRLRVRRWRHVSLWGIAVFLYYQPRRVRCSEHGIKVEEIPWSMGKKPISFPLITVLAFWATHSRIKALRDFAWMLRRHEQGILAYFDLRIDDGAVEAMNNPAHGGTKVISHRARGYRSERTFSLALIHGLGNLELPESQHKFL